MTERTSHWTGLWIGAAISNTAHSNKARSTTATRARLTGKCYPCAGYDDVFRSGDIVLLIFTVGTRRRLLVTFKLRPLYSSSNYPHTHWTGGWGMILTLAPAANWNIIYRLCIDYRVRMTQHYGHRVNIIFNNLFFGRHTAIRSKANVFIQFYLLYIITIFNYRSNNKEIQICFFILYLSFRASQVYNI